LINPHGELNINPNLYLKNIYNFGLVHQKPIFVKELNIKENILLPIVYNKFINKKEAIEKAEFLANQFNLSHILKQKVTNLSGGEKQRVSIIRALIEEPKILFLDEPTGALDEDNAKILIELLNKLKEELNLTIVMVTHNHNTLIHCNKKYTIKNKTLISID
jgi:putative ABC transport system ATP-binding protein